MSTDPTKAVSKEKHLDLVDKLHELMRLSEFNRVILSSHLTGRDGNELNYSTFISKYNSTGRNRFTNLQGEEIDSLHDRYCKGL